jgi:hypothetical protein
MKKLIASVFIMLTVTYATQAQTAQELKLQIRDIQFDILKKLNNITNENRGGTYGSNKLSDWHNVYNIKNNSALYEFYYPNDSDGKHGQNNRYRIDMTKISRVTMGQTNAGNDGFFFYAQQGESAIQRYTQSNDWDLNIGAPSYRNDQWVQVGTIQMPQDEELLELFREYIDLVQKHKDLEPLAYGSLNDIEYFPPPSNLTNYNNLTNDEKVTLDFVNGVTALFAPSPEKLKRDSEKISYKIALDKSLEEKKEKAKNGDDQSYYDIYSAYEYSYKKDARYYKKLAFSTGNASVFKERNRLERISPKGIYIGLQSGEISRYGVAINQTTNNFGFFMSFRMSIKDVDYGTPIGDGDKVIVNRDLYVDDYGNTYTFLSEAPKEEIGRYTLSLGTNYHIYKPIFIYAGIGFGMVNTYSWQKKVNTYNKEETLKIDESDIAGSTDAGILLKLGRLIAINGGVSFMNLKNPEYVLGINYNFFPEK